MAVATTMRVGIYPLLEAVAGNSNLPSRCFY